MSETETHEREHDRYPHVLRAVREMAWAVLPSTLLTIRSIIVMRAEGQRLTADEIQARIGGRAPQKDFQQVGSVAVLPIYGVLVPRADIFTEMSGGTSVQRLQAAFRDAVADETVSAIVLDVESPGGAADLIPEFAADIRAARGVKPIVAVANTRAASGAYWLAAQADELVATKSGDVGSIGVFAAHEDVSKQLEAEGVNVTLIQSKDSPYKTELSPIKPLSKEAEAWIQGRVDDTMAMFVADVAAGRGVSVESVRSSFGQGRMLSAAQALEAGMIDRIDTLEATVQRLSKGKADAPVNEPEQVQPGDLGATAASGTRPVVVQYVGTVGAATGTASTTERSFEDEVEVAHRAFDAIVTRAEALRVLTGRKRDQLAALVERTTALLAAKDPEGPGDDDALEHELELVGHAARLRH